MKPPLTERLACRVPSGWVKRGNVWSDRYHPEIYRPRDHSKHSKKQKR